jgi:hypothetical protein
MNQEPALKRFENGWAIEAMLKVYISARFQFENGRSSSKHI